MVDNNNTSLLFYFILFLDECYIFMHFLCFDVLNFDVFAVKMATLTYSIRHCLLVLQL